MLIHRGEHCYCGLNGGNGFFGTCPCFLCGGIPCSPQRIQTLKTNNIQNVGNLPKIKRHAGRDLYTSLRREYKKAIVTAKREGWIKFTSEIKHPSDISKLIKSFNNCKKNALGLFKKNSDGDYCDNPTDSLNILLGKFFPGHAALSETNIRSRDDAGMDWIVVKNNRLNKTFTIKKVKAAFAHMGSYKSAGPDGFKPIVMKHFGPRALGCITNIFQAIYSTGYIPIEFHKSKVVFIPKPSKR